MYPQRDDTPWNQDGLGEPNSETFHAPVGKRWLEPTTQLSDFGIENVGDENIKDLFVHATGLTGWLVILVHLECMLPHQSF